MDVMMREEGYNNEIENDRQWFREATRFALYRQNLREKGKTKIDEACLYEITCKSYPKDESRIAEFKYPPSDSLYDILLLDEEDTASNISNFENHD